MKAKLMADITIDIPRIRKNKYFIATPAYAGVGTGYCESMIAFTNLLTKAQIEFTFNAVMHNSLLPLARNELAAKFLASDCTHMLCIDGHFRFEAMQILSLLNRPEDFLSLACPLKVINWQTVKEALTEYPDLPLANIELSGASWLPFWGNEDSGSAEVVPFEPVEIERVGTGFLLLSRKVFETLIPVVKAYENVRLDSELPDTFYNFFPLEVDNNGTLLSEDLAFCKMWREQGGKVYLCPWISVESYGSSFFRGQILNSFS